MLRVRWNEKNDLFQPLEFFSIQFLAGIRAVLHAETKFKRKAPELLLLERTIFQLLMWSWRLCQIEKHIDFFSIFLSSIYSISEIKTRICILQFGFIRKFQKCFWISSKCKVALFESYLSSICLISCFYFYLGFYKRKIFLPILNESHFMSFVCTIHFSRRY